MIIVDCLKTFGIFKLLGSTSSLKIFFAKAYLWHVPKHSYKALSIILSSFKYHCHTRTVFVTDDKSFKWDLYWKPWKLIFESKP